jgi:hypothetical protein
MHRLVMTPAEYGVAVAAEVRAEMGRQGRTAMELAVVLGVSTTTARSRMSGAVVFDVVELLLVATWLDVPVERLALRDRAEVS